MTAATSAARLRARIGRRRTMSGFCSSCFSDRPVARSVPRDPTKYLNRNNALFELEFSWGGCPAGFSRQKSRIFGRVDRVWPRPYGPKILSESGNHSAVSRNIGRLVLLRHGESEWNKKNLFTGWRDVRLTPQGEIEARPAGKLMAKEGFLFDLTYTSLLRRAIHTLGLALEEMDQMWLPVEKHWRLNERHYGALQAKDKKEAVQEFGEEQVLIWRRSYATPPPPVDVTSEDYPKADRRYAHLKDSELPLSESLKDVLERVMPYWEKTIVPQLGEGKNVLIVAHGNSLRALMKHLENISDEAITKIDLPTGEPRAYVLNDQFKATEARYLNDPAEI